MSNPVVKGNLIFSQKLYHALSNETASNTIMSSYSLASLLSMLAVAGKSTTWDELKQVLNLPEDKAKIQEEYDYINSIIQSTANYTLENANAIFMQKSFKVNQDYMTTVKDKFHSELREVDFAESENSRRIINDWVLNQTKKKISELFPSGSFNGATRIVLVNAIYFKGDWAQKFNPKLTVDKDFYLTPDETVKVPMMIASNMEFGYDKLQELDAAVLEMPYKGNDLSMYIVLPDENSTLKEMEEKLLKSDFSIFTKIRQNVKVKAVLPKFKITSSYNLNGPLNDLGLKSIFGPSADFSGISGSKGDLYVSTVIQKAVIEVNEEGSEAAAASGISMRNSLPAFSVKPPTFIADRPFHYFISHKPTGLILFSGKLSNPSIE